jgi:hypothetical protein
MPSADSDLSDQPDCVNQLAGQTVSRRSVLNATLTVSLAATSTMVLGTAASAATATSSPGDQPDFLDVSRPEIRGGRGTLRLKLDDSPNARPTAAVPLAFGTSQNRTIPLTVTSTTGRVGVGPGPAPGSRSRTVTVSVGRNRSAVVWVTPLRVGAPLVAADTLTVGTPDGDLKIEVWIEPVGGRWTPAGPNGTELDLNIVAIHAALMSRPGNSDIVMWSTPRMRDPKGHVKPDPARTGQWQWQWQWWKFQLNDVEARVLDIGAHKTSDTPLPKITSDALDEPRTPRVDNIFCAGAAHLPNGNLLVVGGHLALKQFKGIDIRQDNNQITDNANHLYIYDASRRTWRKLNLQLTPSRWYPTVTALPDGRMLIASGSNAMLEGNENDNSETGYWKSIANSYLIFDPTTETLHAGGANLIDQTILGSTVKGQPEVLATYPSVFVLPKPGRAGAVVVVAETNRGWLYDYQPGNPAGPLVRGSRMYPMKIAGSRSYPTYGAMVLLPIKPHQSTMRILAVGGQGGATPDHRSLQPTQPATDVVEIFQVDTAKSVSDPSHGWRYPASRAKLRTSRVLCDTTLLADGTVLISGGSRSGWGDLNRGPVLDAELFDPETEAIRPAAHARIERRYHSTALLQLDGTVLKAGSTGGFGNVCANPNADQAHRTETDPQSPDKQPWMTVQTVAERYWPPYLFAGPRPTIVGINGSGDGTVLKYNAQVIVSAVGGTLDDKVGAALIRLGSLTHGNDMDQRYVWLVTTAASAGTGKWTICLATPTSPAAAPPGDYQLVLLDSHGVPSPGRLVRLTA